MYYTLIEHPEFYEENKNSQRQNIGLYLDYSIYSPNVPVIRNDKGEWLEEPYMMNVLTSPAPNKYAIVTELGDMDEEEELMLDTNIGRVFYKRMQQVLGIMAENGHKSIVLGCWGCGAFGGDPYMVSCLFDACLRGPCNYFDKVTFAIFDSKDSDNFRAFSDCFS